MLTLLTCLSCPTSSTFTLKAWFKVSTATIVEANIHRTFINICKLIHQQLQYWSFVIVVNILNGNQNNNQTKIFIITVVHATEGQSHLNSYSMWIMRNVLTLLCCCILKSHGNGSVLWSDRVRTTIREFSTLKISCILRKKHFFYQL